jgi:hypothetical protein
MRSDVEAAFRAALQVDDESWIALRRTAQRLIAQAFHAAVLEDVPRDAHQHG